MLEARQRYIGIHCRTQAVRIDDQAKRLDWKAAMKRLPLKARKQKRPLQMVSHGRNLAN